MCAWIVAVGFFVVFVILAAGVALPRAFSFLSAVDGASSSERDGTCVAVTMGVLSSLFRIIFESGDLSEGLTTSFGLAAFRFLLSGDCGIRYAVILGSIVELKALERQGR